VQGKRLLLYVVEVVQQLGFVATEQRANSKQECCTAF